MSFPVGGILCSCVIMVLPAVAPPYAFGELHPVLPGAVLQKTLGGSQAVDGRLGLICQGGD